MARTTGEDYQRKTRGRRNWSRLREGATSRTAYQPASGLQIGSGGGSGSGGNIGGTLRKIKDWKVGNRPGEGPSRDTEIKGAATGKPPSKTSLELTPSAGAIAGDPSSKWDKIADFESFEALTAYSQKYHDQFARESLQVLSQPRTEKNKHTWDFHKEYQVQLGGSPWVNAAEARKDWQIERNKKLGYEWQQKMDQKNLSDTGYETAESPLSNSAARALVESGQIPSTMTQSQIRSILSSPGRTSDYDLMLLRRMLI